MSQPTPPPQPPSNATVTLPGVGKVQRRWVVVGGLVVVVIVGYAYYARSRSGAGEMGFDPATGTPGGGSGEYVNPDPDGPPGDGTAQNPAVVNTNAEWGPRAVEALAAAGWDPQFAATAIGKYLTGQGLSDLEEQAVRAAVGLTGWPPVGPPTIMKGQAAGGTGGGGTTPPAPTRYGGLLDDVVRPPKNPPTPRPPRRYVVVHAGDWRASLASIAARAGRSVLDLMRWNSLSTANVRPGQRIYIDDPTGRYMGETEFKG